MDKGAWQATVHGVTKSQTQLKRLSTHAYICVYIYTYIILIFYLYIYDFYIVYTKRLACY